MARVRRTVEEEMPDAPTNTVDAAIMAANDEAFDFDEIKGLFTNLQESEDSDKFSISLMVRKSEGASWSFLETSRPDIQTFSIERAIENVLNERGPGNYKYVVRVGGTIKKHIEFNVGDPRKPLNATPQIVKDDSTKEFLPLLITMMQESNRSQQAASERLMLQMHESANKENQMMLTLLPALTQRQGPSVLEIITGLAPIIPLIAPMIAPKNNMKEMIELMILMKNEMGGDGGGEDGGFLKMASSFAGPIIAGLTAQGEQAKLQTMQVQQPQRQQLAAPVQQPQSVPQSAPQEVEANSRPAMHPILALIKDEIELFAKKGQDPTIAAETLAAILEMQGITYEQLVTVAQQLMVTPDWIESLYRAGVDLRQHREWAQQVIQELINIMQDNSGSDALGETETGDGGNKTDAEINVPTSENGEPGT